MSKETMEVIQLFFNCIVSLTSIFTLIILIYQLKKMNKLSIVQSYHARYQLYLEMDKLMVQHPYLRQLIGNNKYLEDCKNNIISEQYSQKVVFIEMVLNLGQLSYYQYKDKVNDSELNWLKDLILNQEVIAYWESGYRCSYRTDFTNFVNGIIISKSTTT
jgi:hypothetical protein